MIDKQFLIDFEIEVKEVYDIRDVQVHCIRSARYLK